MIGRERLCLKLALICSVENVLMTLRTAEIENVLCVESDSLRQTSTKSNGIDTKLLFIYEIGLLYFFWFNHRQLVVQSLRILFMSLGLAKKSRMVATSFFFKISSKLKNKYLS